MAFGNKVQIGGCTCCGGATVPTVPCGSCLVPDSIAYSLTYRSVGAACLDDFASTINPDCGCVIPGTLTATFGHAGLLTNQALAGHAGTWVGDEFTINGHNWSCVPGGSLIGYVPNGTRGFIVMTVSCTLGRATVSAYIRNNYDQFTGGIDPAYVYPSFNPGGVPFGMACDSIRWRICAADVPGTKFECLTIG